MRRVRVAVVSPSNFRPGEDVFALLGLSPQFALDPEVIERAFREKSKRVHPDRFATAPAAERARALMEARALNDAYQVVKKPVARAEYLLAQAGVTIGDNERLEPEMIEQVLELREELALARQSKDLPALETLLAQMRARRAQALEALAPLFAVSDLPAIKRVLISLRYIDRYLDECDAALDEE